MSVLALMTNTFFSFSRKSTSSLFEAPNIYSSFSKKKYQQNGVILKIIIKVLYVLIFSSTFAVNEVKQTSQLVKVHLKCFSLDRLSSLGSNYEKYFKFLGGFHMSLR